MGLKELLDDPNVPDYLKEAVKRQEEKRLESERALKISEEKFKTIFEAASDEIIYLNTEGVILEVNPAVERIFGYAPEDIAGKNFAELDFFQFSLCNGQEDLSGTVKLFNEMLTDPKGYVELKAKHKDGYDVYVEASAELVKRNGDTEGMCVVVRDVTERKELERALKWYELQGVATSTCVGCSVPSHGSVNLRFSSTGLYQELNKIDAYNGAFSEMDDSFEGFATALEHFFDELGVRAECKYVEDKNKVELHLYNCPAKKKSAFHCTMDRLIIGSTAQNLPVANFECRSTIADGSDNCYFTFLLDKRAQKS